MRSPWRKSVTCGPALGRVYWAFQRGTVFANPWRMLRSTPPLLLLLSFLACLPVTHTQLGATDPNTGGAPGASPGAQGNVLNPNVLDPNVPPAAVPPGPASIDGLSCVIRPDHTGWCQYFDGVRWAAWHQIPSATGWISLQWGLGIQGDGTLWCWGNDVSHCGLDPNTALGSSTPVQIMPAQRWREVNYRGAVCGITTAAQLWCWGYFDYVENSDGTSSDLYARPVQLGPNIAWAHPSGGFNNGALDAQGAHYWLDPNVSTGTWDITPDAPLPQGGSWLSLRKDCGIAHMGNTNSVQCVRRETPGTLMSSLDANRSWLAADGVTQANNGQFGGCAVADDGTLWCWGGNDFGQRGNGLLGPLNQSDSDPPNQVGNGNSWTAVNYADDTVCAYRMQDGNALLYCWGNNGWGQVGNGALVTQAPNNIVSPVRGGPSSWRAVSLNDTATCAIGEDASLWCWGNYDARCAWDSNCVSTTALDYPLTLAVTQVESSGWVALASTTSGYGCGLRRTDAGDANDLWCWRQGFDSYNLTAVNFPAQRLAVGENWGRLLGGSSDALAISADGNTLVSIEAQRDANNRVLPITPPSPAGQWIDARSANWQIWAVWRDTTVVPPTQNIYFWEQRDALPTLYLTGNWTRVGTSTARGLYALRDNGTLWRALGATLVQVQTPTAEPWTGFPEGRGDVCGVQGGHLWCFAADGQHLENAGGAITSWQTVTMSDFGNGCGFYLDAQGARQLACWGNDFWGQLGLDGGAQEPHVVYTTPQLISF